MENNPKKLLFVVNNPAFFVSHRLPVAKAAINEGFEVHIACPVLAYPENDALHQIESEGIIFHRWDLARGGINPWDELVSLMKIFRIMRCLNPGIVHLVTPKPNVYGGLAARFARVPAVVYAISGTGYLFGQESVGLKLLKPVINLLYRVALGAKNRRIIVQNEQDEKFIKVQVKARPDEIELISGSGVDLDMFKVGQYPDGIPTVVMACRLIAEKGVNEFVEAARILKLQDIKCRFILAGLPDPANPMSISETELSAWAKEGVVEMSGYVKDMPQLYSQAHIAVLPSYYREGLPRCLIEAAACGLPVITTDLPGCRDSLIPGKTGLLVPARESTTLAEAIKLLIVNSKERKKMGEEGRKLAMEKFSIGRVIARHMNIYKHLQE